MDLLLIEPAWREAFARLRLDSCGAVVRHFTQNRIVKPGVLVKPTVLPGPAGDAIPVFYKQYEFASPSWRFVGRASKARREWDSYTAFAECCVPCAERIAAGEERDGLGRLRRAFLITRTVPGAKTLTEFVEQDCADRSLPGSRSLRNQVLVQLAAMTRRIHEHGFFHNDLYWRNILVTRAANGAPELWWIDCPRGHHARFHREHRRVKDLACLDRMASRHCTRSERLDFVRAYLDTRRGDAEVRHLARSVDNYRRRRWPSHDTD
jgi:tRNA A-37 threonylcarbamoyl transferase component Bud32